MPRPVWSGTISFGLIAIPVKMFHAVNKKNVSFNQLDDRTMTRIRLKKVSADTGEEVPDEHIVKGYEISKGRYVVVDPDELEPFIPVATKSIDLEEFVHLDEIDPVYFDKSYHLIPGSDPVARKPYALLLAALEEAGRVGIGRFVLRTKEHLVAIRPRMGVLGLETLFYADEVQEPPETWRIPRQVVRPREVEMAVRLIESLAAEWDPARYTDTQRARILELLAEREPTLAPEEPVGEAAPSRLPNLMEALRASVEAAKEARKEAQADVRPKGGKGRRPA